MATHLIVVCKPNDALTAQNLRSVMADNIADRSLNEGRSEGYDHRFFRLQLEEMGGAEVESRNGSAISVDHCNLRYVFGKDIAVCSYISVITDRRNTIEGFYFINNSTI